MEERRGDRMDYGSWDSGWSSLWDALTFMKRGRARSVEPQACQETRWASIGIDMHWISRMWTAMQTVEQEPQACQETRWASMGIEMHWNLWPVRGHANYQVRSADPTCSRGSVSEEKLPAARTARGKKVLQAAWGKKQEARRRRCFRALAALCFEAWRRAKEKDS